MMHWKSNLTEHYSIFPSIVGVISLFFILLILFMISNSVVFWMGTKVETSLTLPTVNTVELNVADKLIVTIARSGQIFFNEKKMDWHDLERELGERVRESRQSLANVLHKDSSSIKGFGRAPMIIVRADKEIPYETIAKVMDLSRSLGLNVYLAADPPKTSKKVNP
ncbi:MAG: biopolymer transporter ExbD [Lentisphaeria bacterium]